MIHETKIDADIMLGQVQDLANQPPDELSGETMKLIEEAHAILWGVISSETKREPHHDQS